MQLTKTRRILIRDEANSDAAIVWFDNVADDEEVLCFAARDWRDMGSPDAITVTIEPGDRLNR